MRKKGKTAMHDNLDYHIKEQSKKYDKKRKREMHVKLDNKKKNIS